MRKEHVSDVVKIKGDAQHQRGFTLLQVLITLTIIGIISTFAFMAVARSRESVRLAGSNRELAAYLEKARADAVRRHGTASVQILNVTPRTTYQVTMDFDGNGTTEQRVVTLQQGVQFASTLTLPLTVTFDWRGRTAVAVTYITMSNYTGTASVRVDAGGDISVNTIYTTPTGGVTTSLPTTLSTPTPTPAPTPLPTPTPPPTVCGSNQKPSKDNCTCPAGTTVQSNGKCG